MRSFAHGFLDRVALPATLVPTIRQLGEHKGREELYRRQSPQVLEQLRRAAVIASTESSNRIEGIVAPSERIRALVEERTTPRNRSEQEIAGYRGVLSTIHAQHADIPLTSNVVLQLHRDLYRFVPQEGGRWKPTDNEITERHADGTVRVRFRPVSAVETPAAVDELHRRFHDLRTRGEIEPLILIACYVLDFLCIHPFLDGNGRMARLLTLLLLYHEGYGVGRYISLETLVEEQRDGYYDTLWRSSQGWHEGTHDLVPWWEYFLGVMLLGAYRKLEARTGEILSARGAKSSLVLERIRRLPQRFSYGDVSGSCPGVSRPTIQRVMRRLRDEGKITLVKPGRMARWEKQGEI